MAWYDTLLDPSQWTASGVGDALKIGTGLLTSANQADTAAQVAADAARAQQFRPIGVTTRFGQSGFNFDPATGQLISAGYTASPEIAAQREAMMNLAGNQLQQVQAAQNFQPMTNTAALGLFNLGQQYTAETPQQAAQNWMAQQQAVLAPGREQEQAQMLNKLNRMGTMGLATGATEAGGMAATNPLMAAYQNRKMQEDLQLAAQAQQQGMNQAKFGQGLMTGALDLAGGGYGLQKTALSPYSTYMDQAATLEGLAQKPLDMGTAMGQQITTGATNAANTNLQGQAAANNIQTSALNNLINGISTGISGLTSNNAYMMPTTTSTNVGGVNYPTYNPVTGWA